MCEECSIILKEAEIKTVSRTSMTDIYVHNFSLEGREKRVKELVERIRSNESKGDGKKKNTNKVFDFGA